jgi:pimeloyl-ACP methyl ester carboxylesterase
MHQPLRSLGIVSAAILLLVGAFVAWAWAPDVPLEQLQARWAAPPSQFVTVDGLAVHVRDEGPRDDPLPIVLVHGTSASLHTWEGWTRELTKTRRVIRFDLPGFGLTGPNATGDYSMAAYVRFVPALLDQLGVARCVLGGNSLGGEVAWATAHAQPQRVAALILVDATGYTFDPAGLPLGFRIAATPGLREAMRYLLPPSAIKQSVRDVYGDPARVTPELVAYYRAMALRAGNRQALSQRLAVHFAGREQDIKTLQQPTLILWGGRDRLVAPDYARRFAADIAGSKLVLFEQLGHVPHEEDPAATVAVVQAFLRETDARKTPAAGGRSPAR